MAKSEFSVSGTEAFSLVKIEMKKLCLPYCERSEAQAPKAPAWSTEKLLLQSQMGLEVNRPDPEAF